MKSTDNTALSKLYEYHQVTMEIFAQKIVQVEVLVFVLVSYMAN